MKKALVTLAVLAALAAPAAALAHPLGNFTVNRYSRVEPSGGRIYVLYVLDMNNLGKAFRDFGRPDSRPDLTKLKSPPIFFTFSTLPAY